MTSLTKRKRPIVSRQISWRIKQKIRGMRTDLNEGLVSEHEKNYWKSLRGDVRLHTEEQTDKAYHTGRDMPNNSVAMLAS
jgi:transcription initiation factor IIE alpha subunit